MKTYFKELRKSLNNYNTWSHLALNEIMKKYQSTVLGPLWITFSIAFFTLGISYLYSSILNIPFETYFPYLASGIISWYLISDLIMESNTLFVRSAGILKQTSFRKLELVFRMLGKHFIIFFHNILFLIACIVLFKIKISLINCLYILSSIFLLAVNLYWISLSLAIIGARYRDVGPILQNGMRLLFFITPILWMPELKANRAAFLDYNFFYYLIDMIRAPIIYGHYNLKAMTVCLCTAVIGFIFCSILYRYTRKQIIFWI